jgi:hypothetical protein
MQLRLDQQRLEGFSCQPWISLSDSSGFKEGLLSSGWGTSCCCQLGAPALDLLIFLHLSYLIAPRRGRSICYLATEDQWKLHSDCPTFSVKLETVTRFTFPWCTQINPWICPERDTQFGFSALSRAASCLARNCGLPVVHCALWAVPALRVAGGAVGPSPARWTLRPAHPLPWVRSATWACLQTTMTFPSVGSFASPRVFCDSLICQPGFRWRGRNRQKTCPGQSFVGGHLGSWNLPPILDISFIRVFTGSLGISCVEGGNRLFDVHMDSGILVSFWKIVKYT